MKKHSLTIALAICMSLVLVMGTGCHKKKKAVVTTPQGQPTASVPQDEIDVTQEWLPWTELSTVYFAFDSYSLSKDSVAKLEKNAEVIKGTAGVKVRIEGSCDERGTQEYNMALGQKRAQAVCDYLAKMGVPADRLVTVSFGEEKPADPGHDEAAWAKNRRCDFSKSAK